MQVIADIPQMQRQAGRWLKRGVTVAFVPTMGCLHEGHLSLVSRARREVGSKGIVVVSIYVNPTQFGPKEDFSRYPRDLKKDTQLCRQSGVDVVFTPTNESMYPGKGEGRFSTYVVEERLARVMEGRSRPSHFRGVTTVVAKLFNIVRPQLAVFGAKDWQQATIIKRMVADLNIPVQIIVAPTARESDGLALSSRNQYLTALQREQATVLWQSMQWAKASVRRSSVAATKLRAEVRRLIQSKPDARLDYVDFFEGESLEPVKVVKRGTHMALAVFIGKTRLIDNSQL